MPLTRCRIWTFYIMLLICLVVIIIFVPIINLVGMVMVAVAILIAVIYSQYKYIRNANSNPQRMSQNGVSASMENGSSNDTITDDAKVSNKGDEGTLERMNNPLIKVDNNVSDDVKPKRVRLYYLDNLKAILTGIVVLHHGTCVFIGTGWYYTFARYRNPFILVGMSMIFLNQIYFMCLFFFISGYFTPTSCDKKGRSLFMADKLKRLGIPFLLYLLIIGPICNAFMNFIALDRDAFPYSPDPGPTWFLAWLLIFNTCYVSFNDSIPIYQMQFPSLWKLVLFGCILGLIQFSVTPVGGNFIFMPITFGSLPFDIAFFTAGIIAKRNRWLKDVLTNLSKLKIYTIRIIFILFSLIFISILIIAYVTDLGIVFPRKDATDNCDNTDDSNDMSPGISALFGFIFVVSGIGTIFISLGLIQLCAQYLNFTNKYWSFFASTAYPVYWIHPLVLIPISYTFVPILQSIGGPELIFCDNETSSATNFGSNARVWFGWFYVNIITQLIVWPLGYCIKKLPGFNKIF